MIRRLAGLARRRADLIILVAFILAAALANSLLNANSEHSFEARQAAQQAQQQAQSRVLEHRLCTSLNRLAALRPPPGNPASNPSRAYEQDQHDILAQLGPDVGCPR